MASYDWQARHANAWAHPRPGCERGIKLLIEGLREYASGYRAELDSPVGDDGVIGEEWRDIAKAVIGLLNGPSGRFDCGSLDGLIRDLAQEHGFERDLGP